MANQVEKVNAIEIADIEKINNLTDDNIEKISGLEFAGVTDAMVLMMLLHSKSMPLILRTITM